MLFNYSTPEHPQDSISIHHNTWNRIGGRMPELSCESPYCSNRPLNLELSNNLIWDQPINVWYNSSITPAVTIDSFFVKLNWINNYSVGRSTYTSGMMAHNLLEIADNRLYISGNKMKQYPTLSDYDLFYCCNDFDQPGNNPNTDGGIATHLTTRHPFPSITYTQTDSVTNYMFKNAGAFPRDSMDTRLMSFLPSGIPDTTPTDSIDHYHDAYILSFDTLNPPVAPIDSDNDGMPDYWEAAHGLNSSIQDHNATNLSVTISGIAGYTNLECYLNCLSDFVIAGHSSSPCDIIAGITSFSNKKEEVTVYPNPNNGIFYVKSGTIISILEITNVLGEKIYSKQINARTAEINLSKQPTGVYFYQLETDENEMLTGKIIIE